ncbi:tol-pal system-associated acyl-CoA thioesterase [Marinicauda algicola]|uniref:Tol-pal system-associated acyl-CoA thioesterase n=1 Tax=Marinicauda algicola TaxID=2029849 RepID=A0A4S2H3U4_9PROT|nr:tol-pal system-associated acyl-CoA thioesterase [Marinicauda algicola]TGY90256.1 tol-pal system-associated acyl-CoA thioesterase [Marinicauda algicola]
MSDAQTPEAGRWTGPLHLLPVRVYYEDTDFTGVVYYANYLKFFERGRTDALRTAGVSHEQLLRADPPLGFAVRRITVEYALPARIDDALTVETRFLEARGARMAIAQRILRGDDLIATAEVEAACIDLDGRPRRLPKSVSQALAARLD